ncbi:hypothetical protein HDV62DRAFT_354593, partial [Trichoderma sp. SZMC 28011]
MYIGEHLVTEVYAVCLALVSAWHQTQPCWCYEPRLTIRWAFDKMDIFEAHACPYKYPLKPLTKLHSEVIPNNPPNPA